MTPRQRAARLLRRAADRLEPPRPAGDEPCAAARCPHCRAIPVDGNGAVRLTAPQAEATMKEWLDRGLIA